MTYPAYKKYKDSGVEWLGKIPDHWVIVSLKMLLDVRDGTHDTPAYVDAGDSSFPLVTSKDVTTGELRLEECKHISKEDYLLIIKRSKVDIGDILMPMIGTVGSPVIVKEKNDFAIKNLALFKTASNKNINTLFLNFYLQSNECEIQFSLEARGGVQNFVSLGTLRDLGFPMFLYKEQTQIATFLDRETQKIDRLIEKQQQLIKLLQEKRQAVISHAVTKGLNPNAKMKDSGVEWLGEIPEHWEIKRLKYLGNSIIGLTYSPDDVVDEGQGTLVLRSSNVQDKKITFDRNVYVNKKIPEKLKTVNGDILICSRNGSRDLIGKNALIDNDSEGLTFGAFMTIFRSQYNEYLSCVFNSTLFEFQSSSFLTSTINQLTVGNLNSFEIPLPPKKERLQIIDHVKLKAGSIDRLIEKTKQAIQLSKERRTALISATVTGKIDVRNITMDHTDQSFTKQDAISV